MKIVVFGASGNLGRRVLAEALGRRHQVTAFVRDAAKVAAAGATIVVGDIRDAAAVEQAIRGQDLIVSALGPGGAQEGALDDAARVGMRHLVAGAKAAGVKRLIALGESGLLQADEQTLRHEEPEYPIFLRALVNQHLKAYEILRGSDLEWTLVCPPRMMPGARTGAYRVEPDYPPPRAVGPVALEDVAAFLLDEAEQPRFVHHRVGIAAS